jgi:hypothetical protein
MRARALWVVAMTLVSGLLLGGCSAGSGQNQTPSATGASETASASAGQQPGADTGSAPSSATTPMGTAAKVADWTITVKAASRKAEAGGAKAADGKELLVIDFELKNGGKDSGVGPTSFKLADTKGADFTATATSDPAYIFNIEQPIKAGTTRKILIAYEVPKGAGPFVWTFSPFVEGGQPAPAVLEVK